MKKLLVATILCLALVALPVSAAGDKKFSLTIDAWAADVGGLTFDGAQDWTCAGSPANCDVGVASMSLTDGGTIPVVSLAFAAGGGNGFALSFYSMDEDGVPGFSLSDDESYYARVHPWTGLDDHGTWWEGTVSAEMSAVELEWTRALNTSDEGAWHVAFGLSSISYDQNDQQYTNHLNAFGGPIEIERARENGIAIMADFAGFGPSVGIAGTQNLGSGGLKFMGEASLAFVAGESDWAYVSTEDPLNLTTTLHPTSMVAGDLDGDGAQDIFATNEVSLTMNGSEDRNAFVADAMLGLSYGWDMGLTLRLGYRVSLWTNMPGFEMTDDYLRGDFIDSRDVSLSGAFFGAGWNF